MIKLFLTDVDSTLTDGIYHTTEEGVISKNFFTRDFHGMWVLHQTGVKICIITAAGDNVIEQQCNRGAKYAEVIKGSKNKLDSIRDKYIGSAIAWNEIAYIGDDLFDVDLLKEVGICSCPSDADDEVLEIVEYRSYRSEFSDVEGFQSSFPGGKGCVREFADYVLRVNEASRITKTREGTGK